MKDIAYYEMEARRLRGEELRRLVGKITSIFGK